VPLRARNLKEGRLLCWYVSPCSYRGTPANVVTHEINGVCQLQKLLLSSMRNAVTNSV